MLFANGDREVFRRTALVQGLSAAVVVLAAGAAVAAAVQVAPPWTSPAKYDFTQFAGGAVSERDTEEEIEVTATGGAGATLVQDKRPVGAELTRRGLGISGGSNGDEIDGIEVLQVKTIPDGSAQGVTGVWLSNLYCGNDGGNTGGCVTTTSGNNQATGEQGTVEIDYLDPAASTGISCKSFKALGTANLNPDPLVQGDVYVDFGVTLQMVAARFSTKEANQPGVCGLGGLSLVGNNEFSVLGFALDESLDTAVCEANTACDAINIPGLMAAIQNAPQGRVTVANSEYVVDTRECGSGGDLHIDVDNNGSVDVTVPANLCGIPNNAQPPIRQIWIQNIASDLVFNNQFVDIVVENPANTAYACPGTGPYNQPVQTWIPRHDDPTEVPVYLPGTTINDKVVQDVTTACGSYRSTTRALSYLVGNLHYADGADMVAVVSAEISRLEQTVVDSFSCINNGKAQSTLSSAVGKVRSNFDRGNYPRTLSSLKDMAVSIKGTRLAGPLQSCEFDFDTKSIVTAGAGDQSALLYSYLLVQIDHLIFQVSNKL